MANDFAELNVGPNTDRRVSFPVSLASIANDQSLIVVSNSLNDPDLHLGRHHQQDIRIGVRSLLNQAMAITRVPTQTAEEATLRVARLLRRARIIKGRRPNSTRHLTRRYSLPGLVSKGALLGAACHRRLLASFQCQRPRLPASYLCRLTTLSRQALLRCQRRPLHRRTTGRLRRTCWYPRPVSRRCRNRLSHHLASCRMDLLRPPLRITDLHFPSPLSLIPPVPTMRHTLQHLTVRFHPQCPQRQLHREYSRCTLDMCPHLLHPFHLTLTLHRQNHRLTTCINLLRASISRRRRRRLSRTARPLASHQALDLCLNRRNRPSVSDVSLRCLSLLAEGRLGCTIQLRGGHQARSTCRPRPLALPCHTTVPL